MKHPLIPLLDALRTCEVPHDFDGETVSFYNVRVAVRDQHFSLKDGCTSYTYAYSSDEHLAEFALSRAVSDDPKLEEARAFQRNWSEV
jgi:hypothetical protein